MLLVHEPGAIRRVLLENAANYRKDRLQRRILSAGLNDGLLSAEGEKWKVQRRVIAPIFARKTVMDFGPVMLQAAEDLVRRWRGQGDGATLDVAVEMAKVTLDVVERTIFSDGFGSDAEAIRVAMATYFNTIGKISPLDLLGMPDFVPRLGRLRVRSTLKFFEREVDRVISARRRMLADRPDQAPNDLITHLLRALDVSPEDRITEAEVRSNILTFIAAGHETTANTLSWAMFLLSQSAKWRERVEAEARREFDGPVAGMADRLVDTRAVIEETIRLYPPIAAISRVAIARDELNGEVGRTGIAGGHLALRAAPPSPALGSPRSLRPRALSGSGTGGHRSVRLPAVRRGAAHLHRICLCPAGGDAGAGHHREKLQLRDETRATRYGRRCG